MKIASNAKISKWLNYLLYAIAIIAIVLFLSRFVGTFQTARAFHRSVWDWYFFWQPDVEDYILLFVTTFLCCKRLRFGILTALYFVLRSFWFYFNVIFGNNAFLSPDILTYTDFVLHYILFFICLVGLVLWVIELFLRKYRS